MTMRSGLLLACSLTAVLMAASCSTEPISGDIQTAHSMSGSTSVQATYSGAGGPATFAIDSGCLLVTFKEMGDQAFLAVGRDIKVQGSSATIGAVPIDLTVEYNVAGQEMPAGELPLPKGCASYASNVWLVENVVKVQ